MADPLPFLQASTYGRISSYMEIKDSTGSPFPSEFSKMFSSICSYIFFWTFPFVLNIARHKAVFQMKQHMEMHVHIFLAACLCISVNNKQTEMWEENPNTSIIK